MATHLLRRYKMFEEKEVGKATEKGRRRALARFVGVGVVLALILLLTSVTSLPTGYAGAFPGANGKIAFVSYRDGNAEIYVMNADGSNPTRLATNPASDGRPSWSADGTKIAFESNRDGNFEIFVMNADGSNQTQLTFTSLPTSNYQPSWSPDGTKIAFASDPNSNADIYVMNADGTNQTRLTTNPAADNHPSWSPDGTRIAFNSARDGSHEVYVMNADGTNQTRLTNNPAIDANQSWSPDGTKIVFESDRDGNYEIYVMNADGTNQTRLTNNPANDNLASWSPDGTKVSFQSDRDGNGEVYVMNADGTGQTNLSNDSANDGEPDWQPLPIIEVDIGIKPGSDPNSINLNSKGVIPVAILTTDTFDATTIDPLSIEFGPDGAVEAHGQGHIEDADSDGDDDLVLHFNTQDTGIQCGDTSASLTGETFGGQAIEGSDSIKTVGCK